MPFRYTGIHIFEWILLWPAGGRGEGVLAGTHFFFVAPLPRWAVVVVSERAARLPFSLRSSAPAR